MGSPAPNIVWMMADDHAAAAISAYGSRLAGVVSTPNIDRLGTEGARFANAFCTNAICTPSRATVLTGQYSHRNGVRTLFDALAPESVTFPLLLHRAGYQTALVGKWHLHSEPQGFDYYDVLPIHGRYWNSPFLDRDFDWSRYDQATAESMGRASEGHVTEVITEKSLRWLRRRDKDRPFLLLCHHKAPHDDFEYQPRYTHLLDDVDIPLPASFREDRRDRSPGSRHYGSSVSERSPVRSAVHRMSQWDYPTGRLQVRGLDPPARAEAAYRKYLADYLRTAQGLDDSLGAILDFLDEQALARETVVVYTSDHGLLLGEHDRIDKRWMYEETLRIPLLVRYPREVPGGSVVEHMVSNVDFAPTILDLAGVAVPDSMQGTSLRPMLSGAALPDWPDLLYYRYWLHLTDHDVPAHFGIRTPDYKLIFFYGLPLGVTGAIDEPSEPGWELYDLRNDPGESRNLYDVPGYGPVIASVEAELERLRRAVGDTDADHPEIAELMRRTRRGRRPQ